MYTILIIEDEPRVASLLMNGLEENGYQTMVAYDGLMGLRLFQTHTFDLVISDIVLPKMDGFELAKEIRKTNPNIPILMLTALGSTNDKLDGFDAGADDYLVKPFSFQELEARIKALLRRIGMETATASLRCGDLSLDPTSHRAFRNGTPIDLTVKEYRLLEYFILNQGTALNRLTLLKHVWDKDFDTNTNVVDVYVNYLRSKIDKDFDHKLIRTVVGIGYMMEA